MQLLLSLILATATANAQYRPQGFDSQSERPDVSRQESPAVMRPAPAGGTAKGLGTAAGKPKFTDAKKTPPKKKPAKKAYENGAGPTGNNWGSGDQSTGATPGGDFSMEGAGLCGPGQDLWTAAGNVMKNNVIPQGQGYDMGATGWAKLSQPGGRDCSFGPGKQSMCTSATAAAFCQHFADLTNSHGLKLTDSQIAFLNGSQVRAAINGNTYSVALLFQHLGGASLEGTAAKGNIQNVLSQAKTGDVLRIDRNNGTGHSTIFQGIRGDKFCYWTSNRGTNGVGTQCENISSLTTAVVSRFPSDLSQIPGRIDQMRSSLGSLTIGKANATKASEVKWAQTLECIQPPSLQQASGAQPPAQKIN